MTTTARAVVPCRLRVFDLNIPRLFWITVFWYGFRYGKPSAEVLLWPANAQHSWLYFWKWESIPMELGAYAVDGEV